MKKGQIVNYYATVQGGYNKPYPEDEWKIYKEGGRSIYRKYLPRKENGIFVGKSKLWVGYIHIDTDSDGFRSYTTKSFIGEEAIDVAVIIPGLDTIAYRKPVYVLFEDLEIYNTARKRDK